MRRTAPITRSRSGSGWRDEAEKTGQAHRAGAESRRAREGAAEDARAQGPSVGEAVPSAGEAPAALGRGRGAWLLTTISSSGAALPPTPRGRGSREATRNARAGSRA